MTESPQHCGTILNLQMTLKWVGQQHIGYQRWLADDWRTTSSNSWENLKCPGRQSRTARIPFVVCIKRETFFTNPKMYTERLREYVHNELVIVTRFSNECIPFSIDLQSTKKMNTRFWSWILRLAETISSKWQDDFYCYVCYIEKLEFHVVINLSQYKTRY